MSGDDVAAEVVAVVIARQNMLCNAGPNTRGQSSTASRPPQPHLVFDGEVDEVGVDQHLIGRAQLRVVLEEQRRRHLLTVVVIGGGGGNTQQGCTGSSICRGFREERPVQECV